MEEGLNQLSTTLQLVKDYNYNHTQCQCVSDGHLHWQARQKYLCESKTNLLNLLNPKTINLR